MRADLQPLAISYYSQAPKENLDFCILEQQCGKRQLTLNKIEDAMSKIKENDTENPHLAIADALKGDINQLVESEGKAYEKHSHWLLRLAYLANKEQFVILEGHLYKIRLELLHQGKADAARDADLFTLIKDFYDSVDYQVEQTLIKETVMKQRTGQNKLIRSIVTHNRRNSS